MKIVVRVTEGSVTGVVRRVFDEVPTKKEAEALIAEAAAQVNVEFPARKAAKGK